ncbi:RHS repeat-associated core domain-containing protein, partial [Prevotella conceptionensis]|uniref:RHS repeat-associated core domain-containing protein n=1 Tax=Prevotella conceptionensis TaxID=340486 RepID=UPI001E2FC69A
PTLVENDSLNIERRMYWDEDNRLMVLSDNGKTSRYTYNAAGERIVKSHGDLEGVYVNGAPQGITFHETEDYTIYPAPIITVTKNRFTKHYFIGDKRVASKLGTGKFSNVYGISGNNVTAGQKDYAARMMQIEKQREEYYKSLGTPPGVPTMKGATADPDNTGYGYNTIIGELGDHSVPEGWVQRPKFNKKGDVPGPPIQWQKPEDPDNAQPGYGYVPADTTSTEEIFFYHSDHLGSTSYITDAKANITQFDAYLPYGELLVDEHSSSEEMPYKFNGKELDQETGLYYYGARYMNPVTSLWYGVDALTEKYPSIGGYVYCAGNPVKLIDPDGEKLVLAGNRQERMKVLKFLQKLTNDNLFVNRKTGVVTIGGKRWDNRSKNLKTGTSLLRDVINNKHTTTIYQNTDDERSAIALEKWGRKEFKHPTGSLPGSDVQIDIDLSPTTNTVRNPKTNRSENGYTPAEITLGHELIHSLRYMEGISTSEKEDYKYTDGTYLVTEKKQSVEELQTIGLGRYRNKYKYTENMLRREHNFQQRLSHISDD